jgi:AcrR family transcriptional regulator
VDTHHPLPLNLNETNHTDLYNLSQVSLSPDPPARNPFGGVGVEETDEWAGPESTYTTTQERILVTAIRLVSRRGVRHLGMQEVSEAAGVSRATLYRYFPSKDHLLGAAAVYDGRRFTEGLAAALAATTEPSARIQALVAFAFDHIRTHPARSLFDTEPDFVLGYLLGHLPKLRSVLLEQLGDALDTVPAVACGNLTRGQLADLIVRLFASSWIIPELDDRALIRSVNGILAANPEGTNGSDR